MKEVVGVLFSTTRLALLLLALSTAGCSEEVVTAPPTQRPFTLYGILNPIADTQAVLVYPLEPLLQPGAVEPLDAEVRSTDLETGETRRWRDSVVVDARGQYAHIFWTVFRPGFGRTYRIEVERQTDGAKSLVVASVPPKMQITETDGSLCQTVWMHTGDGHPVRAEVRYDVRFHDPRDEETPFSSASSSYRFDYTGKARKEGEAWRLTYCLNEYVPQMKYLYEGDYGPTWRRPDQRLALFGVRLEGTVGNAAWDPARGSFDPELLNDPMVMTNVENGFGFVGAGYKFQRFLCPSAKVVEAAGFSDYLWVNYCPRDGTN